MKSGNRKTLVELTGKDIPSDDAISLVLRALDREALSFRGFFDECTRESRAGSDEQKQYASEHNLLVDLREKFTTEYLDQFRTLAITPQTEKLYIQ